MTHVLTGDCREVLKTLEASSVAACVTDPPYGLEFMGKKWDSFGRAPTGGASFTEDGMGKGFRALPSYTGSPNRICQKCGGSERGNDRKGFRRCDCEAPQLPNTKLKQMRAFQSWTTEWASEVLRVLAPGAYLLAFGGTRTYHRLACAIEDAGFEIGDSLGYLNSGDDEETTRDVWLEAERAGLLGWVFGSGFPKHASKLKPAWEPIVMARKPARTATLLNIDACRLEPGEGISREGEPSAQRRYTAGGNTGFAAKPGTRGGDASGRWPANVLLDEQSARALDEQSGELAPGFAGRSTKEGAQVYGKYGPMLEPWGGYGDTGGASRFFYTSKASKAERWDYLSCDCEAARLHAWESEDRSRSAQTDCTSPERDTCADTSTAAFSLRTSPHGSESTGESRQDSKSITSTSTSKTTDSITSDSSARPSTSESTADASCAAIDGGSPVVSAESLSPSTPSTGISRAKATRSTGVAVPATSRRSSARSNCADCGKPLKVTAHPTVKPVDLMRWLVRLVTPPNGLVLDPFCGSGSTGVAAVLEDPTVYRYRTRT